MGAQKRVMVAVVKLPITWGLKREMLYQRYHLFPWPVAGEMPVAWKQLMTNGRAVVALLAVQLTKVYLWPVVMWAAAAAAIKRIAFVVGNRMMITNWLVMVFLNAPSPTPSCHPCLWTSLAAPRHRWSVLQECLGVNLLSNKKFVNNGNPRYGTVLMMLEASVPGSKCAASHTLYLP